MKPERGAEAAAPSPETPETERNPPAWLVWARDRRVLLLVMGLSFLAGILVHSMFSRDESVKRESSQEAGEQAPAYGGGGYGPVPTYPSYGLQQSPAPAEPTAPPPYQQEYAPPDYGQAQPPYTRPQYPDSAYPPYPESSQGTYRPPEREAPAPPESRRPAYDYSEQPAYNPPPYGAPQQPRYPRPW